MIVRSRSRHLGLALALLVTLCASASLASADAAAPGDPRHDSNPDLSAEGLGAPAPARMGLDAEGAPGSRSQAAWPAPREHDWPSAIQPPRSGALSARTTRFGRRSAGDWSDGLSIAARVEAHDPTTQTLALPAIEAGYTRPLGAEGAHGPVVSVTGACPGEAYEDDLEGRIVLLALGDCAASYQLRAAADAGAAGVVVYGSGSSYNQLFGPAGDIDVPAVMVGAEGAQGLVQRLDDGADLELRILPEPSPEDPAAAADACVQTVMESGGVPGASLAVGRGGEIVLARGYGVKSEGGEPVDERTLFRMGSQVQGMTAALLLKLAEDGRVDLDAAVQDYVPEWETAGPGDDGAIRVRDLLSHTSGLSDWNALDGQRDADALTAWLADAPYYYVWLRPQRHYYYAEPNYQLAGLIAERALGTPFHEALTEEVLAPAGLNRTVLLPEQALADGNVANGHNGDTVYAPDSYDNWAYHPVQGGFTTPSDLVRWSQLLMDGGGDLIGPASVSAMLDAGIPRPYDSPTETGGYLYLKDEYWGEPIHYWMGGVTGWSWSVLMWAPERDLSLALSSNGSFGNGQAVARCVLQHMAGLQRQAPLPTRYTEPETWAPHEGTYTLINRYDFSWTGRVDVEGDHLHLNYASLGETWPSFELWQYFEDTFKYNGSGSMSFVSDEPGSGVTDWFYTRGLIGEHVGDFPAAHEMRGPGCQPLTFTSRVDIEPENVRAFGLLPLARHEGVQAVQDDAADPASASQRYDIELPGEAARFTIRLANTAGSTLHWYLMRDENEDGEFAFPDERWRYHTGSGASKLSNLADDDLMPSGRYQLWIHGVDVAPDASFDVSWDAVAGDDLRVESLPTFIGRGDTYTIDVCADEAAVAGREGPLNGAIVFDYGKTPRVIHVPVTWHPDGAEPTPVPTEPARAEPLYLPLLMRGG